jgi:hypothetical protein
MVRKFRVGIMSPRQLGANFEPQRSAVGAFLWLEKGQRPGPARRRVPVNDNHRPRLGPPSIFHRPY